jgi:hypothetical protein
MSSRRRVALARYLRLFITSSCASAEDAIDALTAQRGALHAHERHLRADDLAQQTPDG